MFGSNTGSSWANPQGNQQQAGAFGQPSSGFGAGNGASCRVASELTAEFTHPYEQRLVQLLPQTPLDSHNNNLNNLQTQCLAILGEHPLRLRPLDLVGLHI